MPTKAKSKIPPEPVQPTLRERQAEQTREIILDALIDQLVDTGAFEYSVFEIARRAGVSVRTVYRHFPDRESLFRALGLRVNARVGLDEGDYPKTPESMVELPKRLFPRFDANAPMILAQLSGAGAEVRKMARVDRVNAVRNVVEQIAADLDEAARKRIVGVFSSLLSANVWQRMQQELSLDGEQSGEAVSWALSVLVEAVRKDNERARRARRRKGAEA